MEKLNVGLSDNQLKGVVDALNKLLADEHVLYIKTRNYHWNVVDPRFNDLHKFLEEQYEVLAELIDEIAENVRQFGGVATGTMTEFTKAARLKEHPGRVPEGNGMLQDLLDDHESIIRSLRVDIERSEDEFKAAEAADFLTAVLEKHNKMAWMLRSFLPSKERKGERKGETKERLDDALVGSRS